MPPEAKFVYWTDTHTFIYANRLAKPKCPKIRGNVYAQKIQCRFVITPPV